VLLEAGLLLELAAAWRDRAPDLRRIGASAQALCFEEAARELELLMQGAGDDALSLEDAHNLSGYSVGHLARLVRDGTIRNAGREGKPLIRRSDVPRKATAVAAAPPALYAAATDVQSRVRRRGGH
jgi:hypothetical protein